MAKYYQIKKRPLTYAGLQRLNIAYRKCSEIDRGLNGDCKGGGEHDWLLLPLEKGQKQYLFCLKCNEYSHL